VLKSTVYYRSSWGTRIYEEGGGDRKKENNFIATWPNRDLKEETFRGEREGPNGLGVLDGEKEWGGISRDGEGAGK
jgi:hypothetical protein